MAAPTQPVDVSDAEFQDFVSKYDKVVVDCWAPWCGPCKRLSPIIEELAGDYGGDVAFAKLNTDDNQSTAAKFGIMSIPTLLVFQNGQRVDQIVGLMPKDQLRQKLDKSFS